MPMFGPGLSVSLMLCPAYAPVPAAIGATANTSAAASMDMAGMDMPGMDMSTQDPTAAHAGQSGHPDHQEHTLCPYAASATLATPPTCFSLCPSELPVTRFPLLTAQISFFRLAQRAQSARAPPLITT